MPIDLAGPRTAEVMAKKLVEHRRFCYFQITAGQSANAARNQNEQGLAPGATGSLTTP
jgi:hypothetical protein